jgi:hypothetical protein
MRKALAPINPNRVAFGPTIDPGLEAPLVAANWHRHHCKTARWATW